MQITLTEKDFEKSNIQYSESGQLIDEIAYSVGEPTSACIYEYSDYIPEPYNFNFEADLLANTKTEKDVAILLKKLESNALGGTTAVHGRPNLQAGAYYAINYPNHFNVLLKEYKDAVQSQEYPDILSTEYQAQKEKAESDYYDEQYKEWLNGDYSGNYRGVLYHIKKYFGLDSVEYSTEKPAEITFCFDNDIAKDLLEAYNGKKLTVNNYKAYILENIKDASVSQKAKDKLEREKQKAERERLAKYRAEQDAKETQARIARLSKLTLN